MSFGITGMFRSGTKFLADNMDRSKVWTVHHERLGSKMTPARLKEIAMLVRRGNYAEVNYKLLPHITSLPFKRRGVVFRDPKAVWLSITSWRVQRGTFGPKRIRADLGIVERYMPRMFKLVERGGCRAIDFERMTTERDYLEELLRYFGVDDVEVTGEMVRTKIHSTAPETRRMTFDDFSVDILERVLAVSDAYRDSMARLRDKGLI